MALNTAAHVFRLRGLTSIFDAAARNAKLFYPKLCVISNSTGADEQYAQLGAIPAVRQWLGDRKAKTLHGAEFTLPNKDWEITVQVEKNDLDDDRLGAYDLLMQEAGVRAMQHPDKLLFQRMVDGASSECVDGQYFFDTDHSWGDSGAQSNALTVDVVDEDAPTPAEFKSAYNQAIAAMINYRDDQGEALNQPVVSEMENIALVAPTALRTTAYDAMTAALVGGGNTNVVLDRPQIYASPLLTDAKTFYVFDVGSPVKPFVFQDREKLSRQWANLDSIKERYALLMTKRRYAIGYLAWWKAVSVTFNTAGG